ncbi:MAG: hypothetical protein R3B13_11090 [Polyangiaceae bacterium]
MRPMLWGLLCSSAALAAACSVDPIDLSGKHCPCEEPYVCDDAANVCRLPSAIGGAGGTDGGIAGASGASGASGAGAGGTGGGTCSTTQKECPSGCVSKSSTQFGCASTSCDPCPFFANATASCQAGACVPSCQSGFGNCDGVASNGCESAVSSVANCGACHRTCSTTNTMAIACSNAKCAPTCSTNFGDCTTPSASSPDNGCETNLLTSKSHCGACGRACSGSLSCDAGACGCSTASQCEGGTGVQNATCNPDRTCSCDGKACQPGEFCIKSTGINRCSCGSGAACSSGQECISGKCV